MTTNQTERVSDEELDQMIWKLERDGMTPKQLSLMRELQELRKAKCDGRDQFEEWMLKKWGRERQEYDFAMGKFLQGENYADSYTRHMWKAWSASRAAMQLSGNSEQLEPVSNLDELKKGLAAIRNSGIAIDGEKILAERDALNSPATPDGWVMVPVEPTKEMIDAGWLHFMGAKNASSKGTYKAMLEAAPKDVG